MLLLLAFGICVSTIICTLIAGSVRTDAGLFCTALGLIIVSLRGGAMRYTLFEAGGSGVFYKLAVELVLLFALIARWAFPTYPHRCDPGVRDRAVGSRPLSE